jgi:hypothetical protein
MKDESIESSVDEEAIRQSITRRRWLQGVGCTALAISTTRLSSNVEVLAQQTTPPLANLIRAMSAVTGSEVAENWINPTASLLGIIISSSKGLREINLGELEPATDFLAR